MIKNLNILVVLLLSINCKAQNPIIPRYNNGATFGEVNNAYYKDVDNFLNQFEGIWQYTTTTDTLTVRFVKKLKMKLTYGRIFYYTDFLVGEFRYVENGVEKTNTLSNLSINHLNAFNYNLYSSSKIGKYNYPRCNECDDTVERLRITFDEPANDDDMLAADFVIRHEIEAGVEKIKVQFVLTTSPIGIKKGSDNTPSVARKHTIPYGNYTLIKK